MIGLLVQRWAGRAHIEVTRGAVPAVVAWGGPGQLHGRWARRIGVDRKLGEGHVVRSSEGRCVRYLDPDLMGEQRPDAQVKLAVLVGAGVGRKHWLKRVIFVCPHGHGHGGRKQVRVAVRGGQGDARDVGRGREAYMHKARRVAHVRFAQEVAVQIAVQEVFGRLGGAMGRGRGDQRQGQGAVCVQREHLRLQVCYGRGRRAIEGLGQRLVADRADLLGIVVASHGEVIGGAIGKPCDGQAFRRAARSGWRRVDHRLRLFPAAIVDRLRVVANVVALCLAARAVISACGPPKLHAVGAGGGRGEIGHRPGRDAWHQDLRVGGYIAAVAGFVEGAQGHMVTSFLEPRERRPLQVSTGAGRMRAQHMRGLPTAVIDGRARRADLHLTGRSIEAVVAGTHPVQVHLGRIRTRIGLEFRDHHPCAVAVLRAASARAPAADRQAQVACERWGQIPGVPVRDGRQPLDLNQRKERYPVDAALEAKIARVLGMVAERQGRVHSHSREQPNRSGIEGDRHRFVALARCGRIGAAQDTVAQVPCGLLRAFGRVRHREGHLGDRDTGHGRQGRDGRWWGGVRPAAGARGDHVRDRTGQAPVEAAQREEVMLPRR